MTLSFPQELIGLFDHLRHIFPCENGFYSIVPLDSFIKRIEKPAVEFRIEKAGYNEHSKLCLPQNPHRLLREGSLRHEPPAQPCPGTFASRLSRKNCLFFRVNKERIFTARPIRP